MSKLTIKKVHIYDLRSLVRYLTLRVKVFLGEYRRKITQEFDMLDVKADHYVFTSKTETIGICRILYEKDIACLNRVAIEKKYRGNGFGKKLMHQVIKEIKSCCRAKAIWLSIEDKNLLSFYKKFGFVENGIVYFNNIPYTSMLKPLDTAGPAL